MGNLKGIQFKGFSHLKWFFQIKQLQFKEYRLNMKGK